MEYREGVKHIIISSFWISIMLCLVRYLSTDYNAYIIVFWRCFFALIFMFPWLLKNGVSAIKTEKMSLYILRALVGIVAMLLWFYALGIMPLPQATALSFTAPIFSAILAYLILKEKTGSGNIAAIFIGFIGALVIIRPGFSDYDAAAFIVLLSTSLWSVASIIIKKLSDTEKPLAITFYMALLMTPLSFIFALFNWQSVANIDFIWLALVGLTSNLAHTSLSSAMSKTELTNILPFDFTRLVFISIMAYIFFGDHTEILDVVGSLIIITSSVYIAKHKSRSA